MKKLFWLIGLLGCVNAQLAAQNVDGMTVEEEIEALRAEILAYQKCFTDRSILKTSKMSSRLPDGTDIDVLVRSDYTNERFVQGDMRLTDLKIALVDQKDEFMDKYAEEIMDEYFSTGPGFHILAHGIRNPEGPAQTISMDGRELNAEQVAGLILEQLGGYQHIINALETPFPIVVHSCNAGKGEDCFGAQLSKILKKSMLNVSVIAAPGVVQATVRNSTRIPDDERYQEYVSDENNRARYKWNIFIDGTRISGGDTYKDTMALVNGPR